MPLVQMPDGTTVEMPDKLSPEMAERYKAFTAKKPITSKPSKDITAKAEDIGSELLKGTAGIAEAPAAIVTGAVGGGLGGLAQLGVTLAEELKQATGKETAPGAAKAVGEEVAKKFTYQPQTKVGKALTDAAGQIFSLFGTIPEAMDKAREFEKEHLGGETHITDIIGGTAAALGLRGAGEGLGKSIEAQREKIYGKESVKEDKKYADLKKDIQSGRTVLPSMIDKESIAGKAEQYLGRKQLEDAASLKNQMNENQLAKKEFGLAEDEPLSHESIDRKIGEISNSPAYQDMKNINNGQPIPMTNKVGGGILQVAVDAAKRAKVYDTGTAAESALKDTARKSIKDIGVGTRGQTAEGLMGIIQNLRNEASSMYESAARDTGGQGSALKANASVKKGIADYLENTVLDNAAKESGMPAETVSAMKNARKQIAQLYTLKGVVNKDTESIDFDAVRRLDTEGLTGYLEDLRRFASSPMTKKVTKGMAQQESLSLGLLETSMLAYHAKEILAGLGAGGLAGSVVPHAGTAIGGAIGAGLAAGRIAGRPFIMRESAQMPRLEAAMREEKPLGSKAMGAVSRAAEIAGKPSIQRGIVSSTQIRKDWEERRKRKQENKRRADY